MEKKITSTSTAWIARDRDECLGLFTAKPKKKNDTWEIIPYEGVWSIIPDEMFSNISSQVKWEDEEPTEIELTIKLKNNKED